MYLKRIYLLTYLGLWHEMNSITMAARTKVDFSRLLLSIIICLLEHNTQYHWAICLHIWCCYLLWSGSPIMKDSLVLLLPCSESWLVMKDVVSVWFSSIFGVKDWELCVSIDSPLPLLILEFNYYKVILIEKGSAYKPRNADFSALFPFQSRLRTN